MYVDLAKLSFRNLFRRGKRSWLTVIGIIIGITAIVALFSLGQGLEDSVTSEFEDLGANTIYVIPGSGLGGLFGGGSSGQPLESGDLEAVRRVPGVDVAGPVVNGQAEASFRGETQGILVLGIPTDESQEMIMRTNSLEVDTGRNIKSNDLRSALAGSNLRSGDVFDQKVRLRSQIEVFEEDVRVAGLIQETGDPSYDGGIVMPIDAVRDLIDDSERIDFIIAEVQAGQEPDKVAEEIERELRDERNIQPGEENFTVSTADDLLNSLVGILNLVQYIVIGIVSIALFVGGLGIMNTMYMSVSERTKEIGVMKAVGATKKQILTIYLSESAVLGFIGGVIGVLFGLGISRVAFYFIGRSTGGLSLEASASPQLILGSLMVSVILGMVSGFLPARKAADLEPVEAIRQE